MNDNTGCGVLITLNANGTATFQTDPNQGPFDGSDDTLVGVVNKTGVPIPSINLSSSKGIFAFDGDGICHYSFTGDGYCSGHDGEYNGPTSSFTNISSDQKSGTVNFDALQPGSSTYFSLENSLTGADFTIPADFTTPVKSVTSTGPYIAGITPIDYSIKSTNFGNTAGHLTITDTIPAGTSYVSNSAACSGSPTATTCNVSGPTAGVLTFDAPAVPGGDSVTATFSVLPDPSTTGVVHNTAHWGGPGCVPPPPVVTAIPAVAEEPLPTPCPTNTTDTTVIPPSANFTVTKAVTSTGPYYAGNTSTPIKYSLTATNSASATAAGNVEIKDTVPTGTTLVGTPACPTPSSIAPATCTFTQASNTLTWDFFGVGIGKSVTATFTVTVNTGTTGSVSNVALWSGPGCETDPNGPLPPISVGAAAQGAPHAIPNATTATPCPTNTTTDPVTPPPVTAPATPPAAAPTTTTTTAAPAAAPKTSPAIAFTGAALDQEWIAGVAAVLLGLGLMFMARWRRRIPKHASRK